MTDLEKLKKICQLVRRDILTATTMAGSGHPTSCFSAVELMVALFFGGPPAGEFFRYDLNHPQSIFNDRIIFSKGHAAPLLYALYHAAGALSDQEILTLRQFNSNLEGHPTPNFKYVDVATGSLGQGLSIGVGMAIGIKKRLDKLQFDDKKISDTSALRLLDKLEKLSGEENLKKTFEREPKVFVLLGDSEVAEGQVWEAMEIASYYRLDNLVAILDVNRLGQRGETMLGWDLDSYAKRSKAFGWEAIIVENGHDLAQISHAYRQATSNQQPANKQPVMIIAKTVKGKGVKLFENKDDWHGKTVPKEKLNRVLEEIGKVDLKIKGKINKLPINFQFSSINLQSNPNRQLNKQNDFTLHVTSYKSHDKIATREAYGDALVELGKINPDLVVLDAETANSTYSKKFRDAYPSRFFEMFIAEQNMVSCALGMSKLGYIPFLSSFAAFLTRAFDQIRIAQYSRPNIKIVGSHAGVSIGADGPTQMGLEDLAMARSVLDSTVFYPSDSISTAKLVQLAAKEPGLFYLRLTREKTPIIYSLTDKFTIGGSKIIFESSNDLATIFTAGITVHEAIKACRQLKEEGVNTAVIDLYSIKPIDKKTINVMAKKTKNIIVVEDHYPYGGLGEAVKSALSEDVVNFIHLCVNKLPRSGSSQDLLRFENINAQAIKTAVKNII